MINWQRSAAFAQQNSELALIGIVTAALFVLPDFLLHYAGYATSAIFRSQSMLLAALLGLTLTLIASSRRRTILAIAILACQALWLGCIAYFGRPMAPEQMLLATHEVADVTQGIIDGWRVLMPPLLTVAVTGALVIFIQRRRIAAGTLRDVLGGWPFAVMMIVMAGYWLAHRSVVVAIPGAETFSGVGPYQTAVATARLLLTPVGPSATMKIADQTVTKVALEEEPVTVAVIMGEGISPARMSMFGFGDETTPQLRAWLAEPPAGFELIARTGFSGGVSTLSSVPAFLKMSYWPVEAEWRGKNLFELAYASSFKSWYFSAQSPHFLDMAGGARSAEKVVTEREIKDRLTLRHDDVLTELARELPKQVPRRFIFFHQRVNHSNYTSHCSHLPPGELRQLYNIAAQGGDRQSRRRAAYDNGLRCWDRNATQIAGTFFGDPGAVHIFITADHSEMMGEDGLWGHSQSELRVAQVPILLLTNRPQSQIARRFRALGRPNWYQFSQVVARSLGQSVATPGVDEKRFYLNTTMPFGRSGYFEVVTEGPGKFKVRLYSREGQRRDQLVTTLPDFPVTPLGTSVSARPSGAP